MTRRVKCLLMSILILLSILTLTFTVQPVGASGTIYIRADGSIFPSSANITSLDNVTYTFTDDNYDEVVVERSNIIIDGDGYTLQGTGSGNGLILNLTSVNNVTIKNTNIKYFYCGIVLHYSSNNSIVGNDITANNGYGIVIYSSSNNSIFGNNMTANGLYGIYLGSSSNYNSISGNNMTANNWGGIYLYYSSKNKIYHSNFIDNAPQVYIPVSGYANFWDDGYPSGGNYWSDYLDVDLYSGPYQNESGSDGIWDHQYIIDADNRDNYPLVVPWPLNGTWTAPYNASAVYPGWQVNITVYLQNRGANPETFNITAYYDDYAIGNQTIQLDPESRMALTFAWNLTGVEPCTYNSTGGYYVPYVISVNISSPTLGEIRWYDGTVTVRRPGDANGDGKIYIGDLSLLGGSWDQEYPSSYYKWRADFNGDGKVYIGDLAILGRNWCRIFVPNKKIIFMSKLDNEKGELYIMDVDGSNIERLTFNNFHENNPALSPDGKKVAFHRANSEDDWSSYEIYILDLETMEEKRLTNNYVLDGHPDWSPDGSKIIFASFRDAYGDPSGTADIYVINVDGTGLTRLTDSPWEDNDPEWSPDGTKIVFKSTRDTKMEGKEQIYVMDADGSNVRRLTFNNNSDHDPSWSPDSKTIAFMRYEGPGIWPNWNVSIYNPWNIYKVDLNGEEERLTDYKYICWLPVFSSDGEKILFYKADPIFSGETIIGYRNRLTIMDPDGSNQQTFISDNPHTTKMQNFDW